MNQITCQVKKIFFAADSGFVSFNAVTDKGDDVTVIGTVKNTVIMPGDKMLIEGAWVTHATYGKQFQIQRYQFIDTDRELNQFRTLLSSGAVKGIGPAMAEKIFKKFGEKTPEVFQERIEELKTIPGIGNKVFNSIKESWALIKDHHFLYGLGMSGKQVQRIIEKYGKYAEEKIQENPYVLAEDIEGIGFIRADQIAENLGIEKDSPFRIKAALLYTLTESSTSGHCYLPEKTLLFETQNLLQLDLNLIKDTLGKAIKSLELIKEGDLIGSRLMANTEYSIAEKLRKIAGFSNIISEQEIIQDCVDLSPFELDSLQINAIKSALLNRVSVITGFPGSGKSLCTKTIVEILKKHNISFKLLAPTGRASKRLAEVTGCHASTIHRFLCQLKGMRGESSSMQFLDDSDLYDDGHYRSSDDYTVFIVDESSMIDVFLLRQLLEEVDRHIVFIGDIDQLPPVGPGNTLRDIIDSQKFPVIRLTKIFRQEEGSNILKAAFAVNNGQVPAFADFTKVKSECSLLNIREPEKICNALTEIVTKIFPKYYPRLDIKTDLQILSPYNKGTLGSIYLNKILQELLNPEIKKGSASEKNFIEFGPNRFYKEDKVIQTRNDYEKNVFNGDIGIITEIEPLLDECTVKFSHTTATYAAADLADLKLGYCTSIHRAQGSESPAIIMVLHNQHYNLLQRNLLYTGITRAQKLLIVISTFDVIKTSVKNDKIQNRHTLLKERIKGEIKGSVLYEKAN